MSDENERKGKVQRLGIAETPHTWNPPEKVSLETKNFTDYTELAKLFRKLSEGIANIAKHINEVSPEMASRFLYASFAWDVAWDLCNKQAQTRSDQVGPEDYAPSLAEPVLAVIESIARGATDAYVAAYNDATRLVKGAR